MQLCNEMIASAPDKNLVRLYALIWVLGYLAIYFVFRNLLPEKSLSDATYIQEIIGGYASGPATKGYKVMANLFSLFPNNVTWVCVGLFDAYILYRIVAQTRTFGGMFLFPFILIPFIGLNLQAPTKETLVLAITLFISHVAQRIKNENLVLFIIVVIYALYGGAVRDYYLLILAVFVGYVAMLKSPLLLRWVYVLPVLVVLLVLPESTYQLIGNARNEVNFAVDFGAGSEVRTYFLNPLPSDNMIHFLGNYGYAFAMLHFPFLKDVTSKEVVLFINVIMYGILLFVGMTKLQGAARLMALLFAAHLTVLIIFEPDYGSYFRHFSSILLYLIPAWVYLENKRLAQLLERQQESQKPIMKRKA